MVDAELWVHDSIIHDVGVVEELFDTMLPPSDKEELFTLSSRHLVDGAVLNSIKVSSVASVLMLSSMNVFASPCFVFQRRRFTRFC